MTASKLTLYNGALLILEERKLASLTEDREPRRVLDDVWDRGAVDTCLELGQWNFAMRAVKIDYDSDVEPEWGFQRAFEKPSDWIRTASMASDEYFRDALNDTRYKDEGGYWYADLDELYVRYVSNGTDYGLDYGKWPRSFERMVEAYLAQEAAGRIGETGRLVDKAEKRFDMAKKNAQSKDAMNEGAGVPQLDTWASARLRGTSGRRDGGSRGSLTG